MNHVSEYVTEGERLEAIRYGAAMELADRGIGVGAFDAAVKKAQAAVPSVSATDILKTSLVFGVPAGLLWYAVSKSVKGSDQKTRKLRSELEYYRQVAHEMKSRLGAGGAG